MVALRVVALRVVALRVVALRVVALRMVALAGGWLVHAATATNNDCWEDCLSWACRGLAWQAYSA